jgi:DNA-binding transcriptional regulator YbjK
MISAGGRARWREVETAVGTMFAVVAQVFGQDPAQMALAEDQHAIAQFGAQGADPPLRVRVRARTARRGLDHLDPRAGKTWSKASVNCPPRSRSRTLNSCARNG